MYRVITFFVLSSFIAFTGCEKAAELTKFDMEYNSTVSIPSNTGINLPFNIITPPITTNSQSTFQSNNTNSSLVEAITLKQMTMTITSPSGADFSFLQSVYLYISADGLPEQLIAFKDPVSTTAGNSVTLDTENVNLMDYIIKDQFTLKVTSTTDETILQDHTIEVNSIFEVDAKILGL